MSVATDLFAGTAAYYARYRPAYPAELIETLVRNADETERGRALDLGCGTGELALPLAARFDEVIALDADADMVAQGLPKAERAGARNVVWQVRTAESYDPGDLRFDLVTAGASFHWMGRHLMAGRIRSWLRPGGAFALAGANSTWNGDEPWQKAAVEIIQRWLGPRRRAGSGQFSVGPERHEDVLRAAGYTVDEISFTAEQTWTLDTFIGYLYSTSFAAHRVLGERAADFEADLRCTLLDLEPDGRYRERLRFHLIVGTIP